MAAGQNMTTLRAVLTQRKPHIPCVTMAYKNTRGGSWPSFPDDAITVWHDFNLRTLNESYGHVLDMDVPQHDLITSRPYQVLGGVHISKPNDIRHLLMWNFEVARLALAFGKKHLDLRRGVVLRQDVSKSDKSATARIGGAPKGLLVDHVIALEDFPMPNLVVGLGRPSSKFQGRRLAAYPGSPDQENLWPLRQLANLCRKAETRYGYILTDEDLVACCFSTPPRDTRQDTRQDTQEDIFKVALMPIPWSKYGASQLTTDLALWWLSMLAMSDPEHRKIVGEDKMIRINQWEHRYHEEKDCWVRRHRYSNFEEPTLSPTALGFPPISSSGAAGMGGNAALFPNLDAGPGPEQSSSSDDLSMLIGPTRADDPHVAGSEHFDLYDPAVSRG